MRNRYIAVRHGESVPSSEHRVCTSLEAGRDPKNGLTPAGREEVARNARAFLEGHQDMIRSSLADGRVEIVCSPFSRTMETAGILQDSLFEFGRNTGGVLREAPIHAEARIRERSFGAFEGSTQSQGIYESVWAVDPHNEHNKMNGVESPAEVFRRVADAIGELEKSAADRHVIFLVSHGDVLRITETFFRGLSPADHADLSKIRQFQTAEFRIL